VVNVKNKQRFILNIAYIIVILILLFRFNYYYQIFLTYPMKDRQFFNNLTLILIYIGLGASTGNLIITNSTYRIISFILCVLCGLFTLIYGMLFCYFDIIHYDIYSSVWLVLHVILGNIAIGLQFFSFIY